MQKNLQSARGRDVDTREVDLCSNNNGIRVDEWQCTVCIYFAYEKKNKKTKKNGVYIFVFILIVCICFRSWRPLYKDPDLAMTIMRARVMEKEIVMTGVVSIF